MVYQEKETRVMIVGLLLLIVVCLFPGGRGIVKMVLGGLVALFLFHLANQMP